METQRTVSDIPLDGGTLCFDFVNTIESRKKFPQHDYLFDYGETLKWCERQSDFEQGYIRDLRTQYNRDPKKSEAVLKKIIETRKILYGLFSAMALHKTPDSGLIKLFNHQLTEMLAGLRLDFHGTHHTISIPFNAEDFYDPLKHIMYSGYHVLLNEDPNRIKECAECGWIFLDKTKNNTRKWCNPLYCGSRTKSRRYYQRKKNGS